MKKNSAICPLSMDTPSPRSHQWLWYGLNFLDNLWLPNQGILDENYFTTPFTDADWTLLNQQTSPINSPSRRLIHLFLLKFPWEPLARELGALHVADIGCGPAKTCHHLQIFSQNRLTSYTGFDIQPSPLWPTLEAAYPFASFHPVAAKKISEHLPPQTNMIFSQSALEHIPDDLEFFQQIFTRTHSWDHPVVQIHFLPSPACLNLYGLHGYRQYHKRKLSNIATIYPDYHYELFGLGGQHCYRLHQTYILGKEDIRQTRPEDYDRDLRHAIQRDFDQRSAPINFYVLLLWPRGMKTFAGIRGGSSPPRVQGSALVG